MPFAIWARSTMLCARKMNTEPALGSACHQPPNAPGQPTVSGLPRRMKSAASVSRTTETPNPNPRPMANGFWPSNLEFARWVSVRWLVIIMASVSGRSSRTPLGAHILTPAPGSDSREFGILRTFAEEKERDSFYESPGYKAWRERVAPLTEGEPVYRSLHGLEA